jgi:hypothetical protein
MEVDELYYLSVWVQENGQLAARKYQALLKLMDANLAQNNQNQKQPIREAWQDLYGELKRIQLTELNFQQLQHLEDIGLMEYLGEQGARYVKRTVKESAYDPATGAEEIKKAHLSINSAVQRFKGLQQALDALKLLPGSVENVVDDDEALARIQFTSDASINNIADLKKWSNDWNDIVRGVGLCVGETPHSVRVVGASQGSILVWIGGTMLFVSFMAHMSRKVSGIVLDGLRVAEAIEDLRHKKISNSAIEQALRDQQKENETKAEQKLFEELKIKAVDFQPEHEAHLKTAVKKFIQFSKKGGAVDYIQPPRDDAEEEADENGEAPADNPVAEVTQELRELISEIRSIKGETYLIEHKPEGEADDQEVDDENMPE